MDYQVISLYINDNIAHITINRPKALNALNKNVMDELEHAMTYLAEKLVEINGVIISGTGEKAFVAGADITEFTGLGLREAVAFSNRGQSIFSMIERFDKPVIAVITGYCLGAGCELAMACHMRIAGSTAKFGQPEVNLGLLPGYGGTQRLVDLVGKTKAMELVLTGDMIGAVEAEKLGLINYQLPPEDTMAKAEEILNKIAKKGPLAIKESIRSINAKFDKSKNGYVYEANAFGRLISSEDAKEGATAFLEKRKAIFKGK